MPLSRSDDLIAEARDYLDRECNVSKWPNLVSQLADALEAAEAELAEVARDRDYMVINAAGLSRSGGQLRAERDAALAVIEEAREWWLGPSAPAVTLKQDMEMGRILSSVPADVLRERDLRVRAEAQVQVLRALSDKYAGFTSEDPLQRLQFTSASAFMAAEAAAIEQNSEGNET